MHHDIPPDERERAAKILAALEETFRPFAETLRFDDEPHDRSEDAE